MKLFLVAVLCMCLPACASLTPTDVNPAVNQVTNTAMSLVAAASGDCTVPINAPNVGAACANLPATATVAQAKTAFDACVAAAAGTRLTDQAAAIQAALCAKATVATKPVVVVPPAK